VNESEVHVETQNLRDTASMAGDSRSQEPERFVDSVVVAEFLSITPRQLLVMARKGALPAYPLGSGQRRVWRFRLSEIAKAMEQRLVGGNGPNAVAIGTRRVNR
jgi:hypothetical protein